MSDSLNLNFWEWDLKQTLLPQEAHWGDLDGLQG